MRGFRTIFLLIFVFFATVSTACNFPGISSSDVEALETVPISTQAVEELLENVQSAEDLVNENQPFQLTITESQLTSFVNYELQARDENRVRNVQIFLRDGKISVTGDIEQNGLYFPAEIVVAVSTDGRGNPLYDIAYAKIGPFDIPASLVDQLTSFIDQAIYTQLVGSSERIYIESITIVSGEMVISGYKK